MSSARKTDEQGLVNLAEKLRLAIDSQTFPVIGKLTVSFGVSANHRTTAYRT
jgi:hypothetical protein